MYWDEALTDFHEGDPMYQSTILVLSRSTLRPCPRAAQRGKRCTSCTLLSLSSFVTLRHISGAQQQAVPSFAAAHANTVRCHLTYFGILSMPSSALDYCVDVRASVWVRIEGQHHLNMELMQRHADGASILADVGGRYPQYADKCLALLCMD